MRVDGSLRGYWLTKLKNGAAMRSGKENGIIGQRLEDFLLQIRPKKRIAIENEVRTLAMRI